MIWLRILLACALTPLTGFATDVSSLNWEMLSDESGIRVFRADVPGSRVVAFRADAVIPQPATQVASAFIEAKQRLVWMPKVLEARVLREVAANERIEYTRIGTPFPLKDRDFVIQGRADYDAAKDAMILSFKSVEVPEGPETKLVRGVIHDSRYIVTRRGPSETFIEMFLHIDPMGSPPKWLVNLVQKNYPRGFLETLRTFLQENKIEDHPLVLKAFAPLPPG